MVRRALSARTGRPPASRYLGVFRAAGSKKWGAHARSLDGHWRRVGDWSDERDAAIAVDRATLFFGTRQPLNEPAASKRIGPASPEELRRLARQRTKAERGSSRYWGVSWDAQRQSWKAFLNESGDWRHIAHFEKEVEAAIAHDRVALKRMGTRACLNFPRRRLEPATIAEIRRELWRARKANRTSRFRGCFYAAQPNRHRSWFAAIKVGERTRNFGGYEKEEDAAEAYDRAVLFYFECPMLNFPRRKLQPASVSALRIEARRTYKERTTSQYRGVHYVHRAGHWRATIYRSGRTYSLGAFRTEQAAAKAYDRRALELLGERARLNFPA